jgi:hypothetical protein
VTRARLRVVRRFHGRVTGRDGTLSWLPNPRRCHDDRSSSLRVRAKLDRRKYPKGVIVSKAEMESLELHRHEFHGDWNYELRPRSPDAKLIE